MAFKEIFKEFKTISTKYLSWNTEIRNEILELIDKNDIFDDRYQIMFNLFQGKNLRRWKRAQIITSFSDIILR